MKHINLKTSFGLLTAAALLYGCKSNNGGFQKDEASGIEYRFFNHDEKGNKPSMGDFVNVKMIARNDKDSDIFNSMKRGGDSLGTYKLELKKSFKGSLEEGILLMAAGDSAEFKISADSLYLKYFHAPKLPPFIHAGTMMTFDIKLVKVETAAQMNAERQQMMQKRMAEIMARKEGEPAAIAKYLADNKITAKPTDDSLFFLSRGGKSGKAIKEGDSVYVKYTLTLLDNSLVETSDHGPGHNSFPLVYSKNMALIKGWVEALGTMHEGETARILLPSSLAYGERGAPHSQQILPYTPIIFDLEIMKVISSKK